MNSDSRFSWLHEELEELRAKNLYRRLKTIEGIEGVNATIEGKIVLLFCGNDYLGLSQHAEVIEAAQEVLNTHGVGAASARLISGTSEWHSLLESRLARFLGKESALVFSTGYLANLGALSALVHPEDTIILDKLCHASLIDAAQLAGATTRIYPHKNLDYLEKILKGIKSGRAWIVTDSLFSMDGDLAPLPELVNLKERFGAFLVLDEAHGTGVFGDRGRGVSEHFGVMDKIDVHIGTLSKALGAAGGFVAGEKVLIDYLVNRARPFIFETAPPSAICAAAVKALEIMEREPGLRFKLWENVKRLRSGLKAAGAPLLEGESPIVPVVVGTEERALAAAEFLYRAEFLVPAVRYPTVSHGKARLRITVSAVHAEDEIDDLISAVKQWLSEAD